MCATCVLLIPPDTAVLHSACNIVLAHPPCASNLMTKDGEHESFPKARPNHLNRPLLVGCNRGQKPPSSTMEHRPNQKLKVPLQNGNLHLQTPPEAYQNTHIVPPLCARTLLIWSIEFLLPFFFFVFYKLFSLAYLY